MSDRFYPEIGDDAWWGIEIILQNVTEDPGYLEGADCPYPAWFKDHFSQSEGLVGEDDGGDLDLEYESGRLFKELKEAKDNFQVNDHAERMAYFRTSTQLMERMVAMRERAHNVKQISRFYGAVLEIMDQILDEDQREEVRSRLKDLINV